MRGRTWRKFQQERVFIKRIKRHGHSSWYHFITANGDTLQNPHWVDCIGSSEFLHYKHTSTSKYDSYNKDKYSPNRSPSYYRDPKPKKGGLSTGKRETDKILTKRLINEYYENRGYHTQD